MLYKRTESGPGIWTRRHVWAASWTKGFSVRVIRKALMAEIRRLPDLWGMFGFVSSSFLAVTRIIKLQALNSSSIFWREQKLLLFQIAELRTRWSREMWSSAGSAATASSTRSGPAEVWPPLPLISSIPMWLVSSDCLCFTCGWLDFFFYFLIGICI